MLAWTEMRVYIFNVTNSEEWLSGKETKLRIDQVGPFVYKETWTKTNVTFHRLSLLEIVSLKIIFKMFI